MRGAIMRGAIMQPTYLPWLGYFSMIDDVDVFVFLDSVQLVKRSWQVRNRIKHFPNRPLFSSKTSIRKANSASGGNTSLNIHIILSFCQHNYLVIT